MMPYMQVPWPTKAPRGLPDYKMWIGEMEGTRFILLLTTFGLAVG